MNILLMQPTYYQDAEKKDVYNLVPPLGLAYVGAVAKNLGHNLKIFDILGRDKELPQVINTFNPDIIGIICMTTNYSELVNLCLLIRNTIGYKKIIIAGGPHITLEPEKSIRQTGIDICVIGEGEETFKELLTALDNGKDLKEVKGLLLKDVGFTGSRPLISNLDTLPDPYYDGFEFDKYVLNSIAIECIRGCPYNCVYCSSKHIYGNTLRFVSPAKVIKNIEFVTQNYNFKEFSPLADTFVVNIKWMEEFCNLLAEKKLNVRYRCNGRINLMTDKIFELLKKSGCFRIAYGVESAVGHVLKNINKAYDVNKLEDVIKRTVEYGFQCHLWFMISLPGESEQDIDTTYKFAQEMKRKYNCTSEFQITRIYPKTPLAEMTKLNIDDWAINREPTLPYPNVPAYYELDKNIIFSRWRKACEGIRDTTIWENILLIPEIFRTRRNIWHFSKLIIKRGIRKIQNKIVKKIK